MIFLNNLNLFYPKKLIFDKLLLKNYLKIYIGYIIGHFESNDANIFFKPGNMMKRNTSYADVLSIVSSNLKHTLK